MKVLWIVNTIFPDAAKHLGLAPPVFGGWMYGLAADLAESDNITLAVATVYSGSDLKSFAVNGIQYYLLPHNAKGKRRNTQKVSDWQKIMAEFAPDIAHIHGTEYGHGMALMNACPHLKFVVSIQGLVSVYHRYFLAGMSTWDVLRNITFRDIVRWNTLFHAKHDFYKRGLVEKKYIRRATAVIGRTDWDYAHALTINPKVNYQFCNESLRDEFYTDETWSLENCRRHSIFLSQAGYPIKGLHQVLKAVALLKNDFPDIFVEVAGHDITKSTTLKDRLKRSGYGRYIDHMIKHYGLEKHIKFLGPLSAQEMKKAYLRAHIFVCPSIIENSPNSLGEAQILGVPCIATYAGGIPSMAKDGESVLLYRFHEHEMLSININNTFTNKKLSYALSKSSTKIAKLRHKRIEILHSTKEIYQTLQC